MKHTLLFLFFIASVVSAQESLPVLSDIPVFLDEKRAILLFRHRGETPEDSYILNKITYAEEALSKAFLDHGLSLAGRSEADDFRPEAVQLHCETAQVRWALLVDTDFRDQNLVWYFSVYDAVALIVRAQELFSLFLYLGVYTEDALDLSAQRLIEKWQQSFQEPKRFVDYQAVQQRQRFTSPQDGVTVFWGRDNRQEIGTIEQNYLIAPLILFPTGVPVQGMIAKDGYWSQDFVIPEGITQEPLKLKVLQKITRHSFGFMLALRSLERSSFDFEYRFHLLPDRLFLSGGWSIWSDITELSGGLEMVHHEWRLRAGLYLLPWNDFVFRLFVSTGLSFILTDNFQSRFLADPFILGAEYHFSKWALVAEYRFPSVLGYSRSSFGSTALNMDSFLSLGVQLKW
ncbi:MAG: hypothetical protein LBO67_02560 [Spirochaetaceae bacterium]|jgi:hypothetical protein|nr:hypothetical protein [Spirochaetaceae bacterium]